VREKQSITALDLCAHQLTRGELDNGERAQRHCQSPWADGRFYSEHLAIAIDERDVNCKAHEKRVDAVAGREDQRVSLGKTVAAEEAAIPRRALEGCFDDAGDERAGCSIPQKPRTVRALDERSQKRGSHTRCGVRGAELRILSTGASCARRSASRVALDAS